MEAQEEEKSTENENFLWGRNEKLQKAAASYFLASI